MSSRLRRESQLRVSNGARVLREQSFQHRQSVLNELREVQMADMIDRPEWVLAVISDAIKALEKVG